MDIRDLAYLQAIVAAGSVAAAAANVGRTAPALTKAVRRLEDELGCPLFTKSGRGVVPTAGALYLVENTRGISKRLSHVRHQMKQMDGGQSGLVRLGVSATMATIYLPHLLQQLGSRYPELRLSIVNGMNDVLRRGLREGELDLVLGVLDEHADPDIDGVTIAADEVCVVAAVTHPMVGRQLALADLSPLRWVLPAPAVMVRQWFDAAFLTRGLRPPVPHIETSSIAILENLIADSDYVSFVSSWKLNARSVRESLTALDVPDLRMPRRFGLVWSNLTPPSASAGLLVKVIRESLSRGSFRPDAMV